MPIYPASRESAESPQLFSPPELNRQIWDRAAARLLAKMLGEFAYEKIIEPVPEPGTGGRHRLTLDDGGTLAFTARRGVYGSWRVDPDSTEVTAAPPAAHANGSPTAASAEPQPTGPATGSRPFRDPLTFLTRARGLLGLDGTTLGHLIRELTRTLSADARLDHTALTAEQLAALDYAELEGHQTGHPWLVASKGRLGFSAADAARFTPRPAARSGCRGSRSAPASRSTGAWAASAPPSSCTPESSTGTYGTPSPRCCAPGGTTRGLPLPPRAPLAVGRVDRAALRPGHRRRRHSGPAHRRGRPPPAAVHPHVRERGAPRAAHREAPALHPQHPGLARPADRADPRRPRGHRLGPGLCEDDPFLRDTCRVVLLGEVASVAVEHPLYDHLPEAPYQYKEILGAIWREPLPPRLAPGERARTLASLLHTDPAGRAFTAELVERSGLSPDVWLKRLFGALLPPLLHFLYRYGTVFSPHGENAIVVFDENDVPVRLAIKDFVDDVNVSAHPLPEHAGMPDEVRAVLLTEAPSFLTQFIHSGLFVGVFRYLSPLCEEQLGVSEDVFWSLVRAEIVRHHARFPELKERFELFDMLTPEIERLCLNRNRLLVDGYRDRASRPHAAIHGTVPNPLHPSARVRE